MNILIIGSGAREHAIINALQRSNHQPILFCCGTSLNPGIQKHTKDYSVGSIGDVDRIVALAQQWQIDLAVIGPEAPLEKGLADALWNENVATIGPKKNLARIETSKHYARSLMQQFKINGSPRFQSFADLYGVKEFLHILGNDNYVIKANGLMGGKGVKIAGEHLHCIDEALAFCAEIFAQQQTVVVEEKLIGQEFSLMCFCDGQNLIPMPLVQDHKRAYENDQGPNTGGMGSYSDANHSLPFLTQAEAQQAFAINQAVLTALQKDCQENFIGILYGSFIATANGVFAIEFNARFGDPESLNVLSILESDFVDICIAMVSQQLANLSITFSPLATVCKYAVPKGYPDQPVSAAEIGIDHVIDQSKLYLGAVHADKNKLIATGSRTAAFVGVAPSLVEAEKIAESEMANIIGNVFHRRDIGSASLVAKRIAMMNALRQRHA